MITIMIGFSHLRLWMSSRRCRWALIYVAFGTLTSINNFAAVTASKAGKEGTLKKIKKCLTVTRYRTPPAIVTIVGTGKDRQGITFHTNTKFFSSGQAEKGYYRHMKKTVSAK